MPLQATSGAASYDAFGGGVAAVPNYIEEVFSTYVYKGTGSQNQNITNGIDLSTKGGLVWIKSRTVTGLDDHWLQDTARGIRNGLKSNSTAAQSVNADIVTAVLTNGYTDSVGWSTSDSVASWTFRKQPKFFDVVTYTGSSSTQVINHSLGAEVGFMVIKRVSSGTGQWYAYHRSLTSGYLLKLSSTDAAANVASSLFYNVTSTSFTVDAGAYHTNAAGETYVAYLFAHNAGGFGLTGTDNVISCGSYTGDDSDNGSKQVNLGFEPQWVLIKSRTDAQNWFLVDNMRGMTANGSCNHLRPNLSGEEQELALIAPTATGFNLRNAAINTSGSTYIYIAIRRGPMKVPTSGTSVFALGTSTSDSSGYTLTSNFPVDSYWYGRRDGGSQFGWMERLTNARLFTASTSAEGSVSGYVFWDSNVNVRRTGLLGNASTSNYALQRAPSFFDEVCYTGTGGSGTRAIDHNLRVAPELLIVKSRSNSATEWVVGNTVTSWPNRLALNNTSASSASDIFSDTPPSSSVFNVRRASGDVNETGWTFVAYLFASCLGVSKVGSYTGTATTKQVDCGFTGGARFVLIKRTDSTGDWYVWDSARGIVAGNDPYLLLNTTAAEVTSTDYIDTYSAGFEISSTAPAAINASGGTFIFLAIA